MQFQVFPDLCFSPMWTSQVAYHIASGKYQTQLTWNVRDENTIIIKNSRQFFHSCQQNFIYTQYNYSLYLTIPKDIKEREMACQIFEKRSFKCLELISIEAPGQSGSFSMRFAFHLSLDGGAQLKAYQFVSKSTPIKVVTSNKTIIIATRLHH